MKKPNKIVERFGFIAIGVFLTFVIVIIYPLKNHKDYNEGYENGYLQGTKDWINGVSEYDVKLNQKIDTVYTKKLP